MKCDYELTCYLNGSPKTFRVPALDVEENTTDADIKQQLKDLFLNVINNPSHELYTDINNLAKTGLVMQSIAIRELPSQLLLSTQGSLESINKTEHDGNTKFVDLNTHLLSASHKQKGLMRRLLDGVDLTLPVINLIAEKRAESEGSESTADSAFGVYVLGNKGIDSINIYTGELTGDLDLLNTNKGLADLVTKNLLIYKVNRALEDWYMKDTKSFNEMNSLLKSNGGHSMDISMYEVYQQYPKVSDSLLAMKAIYTRILTDPDFGKRVHNLEKVRQSIIDLVPVGAQQQNNLARLLDKYSDLEIVDGVSIKAKEELINRQQGDNYDLPFSKDFESNNQSSYKKSERASKDLLKTLSDKLQSVYDITFNQMSSAEIAERFDLNPNATLLYSEQRAFVKDGQIYLNTDKASLAEPIHELGHIVLAGLKASNNALYEAIISKFSSHPDYENISKHYSDLSADEQTEEVFVTTLGEMFNGRIARENTKKWENDNRGFLERVFDNIKNFFAELFGIDSRNFFDLNSDELMNMSFEDIHGHFNNSIINGDFTSVTNLMDIKSSLIQDGNYLLASNGDYSSLYQNLEQLDLDENLAESLWLKTKTPNFAMWAGNNLELEEDGEPALFARTKEKNVYKRADETDAAKDLVYLKGAVQSANDTYTTVAPIQARSVYNAGYMEIKPKVEQDVIEAEGLPMNGSISTVNKTKAELSDKYSAYEFVVREGLNSDYYLDYYPSKGDAVKELREKLMRNNNIKKIC